MCGTIIHLPELLVVKVSNYDSQTCVIRSEDRYIRFDGKMTLCNLSFEDLQFVDDDALNRNVMNTRFRNKNGALCVDDEGLQPDGDEAEQIQRSLRYNSRVA